MPDELNPGQPVTVAQTTAYALPPTVVWIASDTAVEVGMVAATTGTWTLLTGAATIGAATSMLFVRCTTSTNAVVVVKRLS